MKKHACPPLWARGFTLLEMLVVLVIVSLVFTLLMGGLRQVLDVQERLESFGDESVEQELATSWLRDVIEGLQPDERMGPHVFKGEELQIEGLSTEPVSADSAGVPTVFSLRIENDRLRKQAVLKYEDASTKLELLREPADNMRFRFVGDGGEPLDAWPPRMADAPQLPRQILVEWGDREEGGQLALAPQGPSMPLPNTAGVFGLQQGGEAAPSGSVPQGGEVIPSAGGPVPGFGPNPYGLR